MNAVSRDLTRLQIYDLWNAGMSSGEIAKEFTMPRSAVIGVIHRAPEGAITRTRDNTPRPFVEKAAAARRPGHTAPVKPKVKPVPAVQAAPKVVRVPPPRDFNFVPEPALAVPTGFEKPYRDAPAFTCRAVVGTGDDSLPVYCCAPKSEARANWYCDFHAQGLFQKPASKSVKPAFDATIRRTA